jgi:hypothetical protein
MPPASMLKENLSDQKTYYEVIDRISKYLIVLPQSRIRIVDPLAHVFTDRQAIELRFRRFQKIPDEGRSSAHHTRPYLPKWLIDEEEAPSAHRTVLLRDQNRVIIAPSTVNTINRICRLIRKGEYDFSRLRAIAILKNVVDRYDGVPRKSRLQLNTYRSLTPTEKDEYRLMVKPTFPDSLILGALSAVFMQLFPTDYFLPECCGYLPKRGPKEAVRQVMTRLSEGYRIVLRLDVRSFNETVPQERLLNLILRRAQEVGWEQGDVDFLERLIRNFFSQVDQVLGTPGVGIGMGTSLTPLFTNVYLDQLDRYIKGQGTLFSRFGDDLALFFADWSSARQSHQNVSRFVSKRLGQEISETKVAITELQPFPKNDGDRAALNVFNFCAYHFEMNEKNRPAIRIKDATIGKIRRRIKLLTGIPKEKTGAGEMGHARITELYADACGARRVIEKISSLLGFFSTRAVQNGRVQTFFLITGWPAAFLNDVSSEEIKQQFKNLDRYILYRLKRLVKPLGGEVSEAGKFREKMRNMGLRTFMDAWNRHPRPYRY